MKALRTFTLAALLTLCLSQTVLAAGTVRYEGGAERFVLSVGSTQPPDNLFGGFQEIMPGDTRIDSVEIQANPRRNHRVNLYLKATGVESESIDGFLSCLRLRVEDGGGNTVFDGTLDKTTGAVYLGSFTQGQSESLSMTLYAPLELPNRYQDAVSSLGWTFLAEELPLPTIPGKGDGPKTGDEILLPFQIFVTSGICLMLLGGLSLKRRKK